MISILSRLIPSCLKSKPDPIISTMSIKSRINGFEKSYTIDKTKSNKLIVRSEINGQRKVMTLPSSIANKMLEIFKSMDASNSHYARRPRFPIHYPCSDPKLELVSLNQFREKLDQYQKELEKYSVEREQFPVNRNYYFELFNTLDPVFLPKSNTPPPKPAIGQN